MDLLDVIGLDFLRNRTLLFLTISQPPGLPKSRAGQHANEESPQVNPS